MERQLIVLELPLPPSPNTVNSRNPLVRHAAKRKYQRKAWREAIMQVYPMLDPPQRVTVSAAFRVWALRDEDNLAASLKWVLDALRQRQTGKDWRDGVYSQCGYIVDDSPEHMTLGAVTQTVDRKNKGVTVTIAEGIQGV